MKLENFEKLHGQFKKLEGLNEQIRKLESLLETLSGEYEVKELNFNLQIGKKTLASKNLLHIINISNKEFCQMFLNQDLGNLIREKIDILKEQFEEIELTK